MWTDQFSVAHMGCCTVITDRRETFCQSPDHPRGSKRNASGHTMRQGTFFYIDLLTAVSCSFNAITRRRDYISKPRNREKTWRDLRSLGHIHKDTHEHPSVCPIAGIFLFPTYPPIKQWIPYTDIQRRTNVENKYRNLLTIPITFSLISLVPNSLVPYHIHTNSEWHT